MLNLWGTSSHKHGWGTGAHLFLVKDSENQIRVVWFQTIVFWDCPQSTIGRFSASSINIANQIQISRLFWTRFLKTASFSTYPIHNDRGTREKGDHCHYYHVIMDTYIYHSKDSNYVNHLLKHFYNIRRRSMTVHVKLSYATHQLIFF